MRKLYEKSGRFRCTLEMPISFTVASGKCNAAIHLPFRRRRVGRGQAF